MEDKIDTEDAAHLNTVEEAQEIALAPPVDVLPFVVGEKVVHSQYYIRNVLRGNHKKIAETKVYEVIGCTGRSVSVRVWGSSTKYGPQFPHKYIEKAPAV